MCFYLSIVSLKKDIFGWVKLLDRTLFLGQLILIQTSANNAEIIWEKTEKLLSKIEHDVGIKNTPSKWMALDNNVYPFPELYVCNYFIWTFGGVKQ